MNIEPHVLDVIRDHARQEFGDNIRTARESCGVIIVCRGKQRYVPCRNLGTKNDHFIIDPEDYAKAEDAGEVIVIVHSHPGASPLPSQADKVSCEQSGLPWLIVNWPTGATHLFMPTGYEADLIGREFSHGVLDCYALIRDYYKRVLKITLPDFQREDLWWNKGQNLYLRGFEEAGFVQVDLLDIKVHDGLLMQVAAPVPNHAAIWLGDGKILHHMMNRLSSRDVYGGWYRKIHTHTVRHRSML